MYRESSSDIAKIFYNDVKDKKRTATGAFHMKGKGKKHGVSGGVRFSKNNFKKYEKNSKVLVKNIFKEVIPYEQFREFEEEKKIQLINEWKSNGYSNNYILTRMGVTYNKFNIILDELGFANQVDKDDVVMKELSEIELNELAESEVLERKKFDQLPDWQKFVLTQGYKRQGLSNSEVAERLNYQPRSFNTKKSEWKRAYKDYERTQGNEEETRDMSDYDDSFLIGKPNTNEVRNSVEEQLPQVDVKESSAVANSNVTKEVNDIPEIDHAIEVNKEYGSKFIEKGVFNGFEAANKLRALAQLTDGNSFYDVQVIIKQKIGRD